MWESFKTAGRGTAARERSPLSLSRRPSPLLSRVTRANDEEDADEGEEEEEEEEEEEDPYDEEGYGDAADREA